MQFDSVPLIQDTCDKLSLAWHFLSGQSRPFYYLARETAVLQYAEFSSFISLSSSDCTRCGGVGVLMGYDDALAVATHMFGVASIGVRTADLDDACAEACNVLSDCVVSHFDDGAPVGPGLPCIANPALYDQIAAVSKARAVFQAPLEQRAVVVVLFDRPCGPNAMPCNA